MSSYSLKPDLKRSLRLAKYFQIAWILAGALVFWLGGDAKLTILFFLLFTAWVPALVELVTRTRMPMAIQVHYLAFITASSVVGSALGMYGYYLSWDTLVHIDSGILLAWLGFFMVYAAEIKAKIKIPRWLSVYVALLVPLAFAALWEMYEYMSDAWFGTSMVPNLEDTIIDMFAGLVGAIIGVVLVRLTKWPRNVYRASSSTKK